MELGSEIARPYIDETDAGVGQLQRQPLGHGTESGLAQTVRGEKRKWQLAGERGDVNQKPFSPCAHVGQSQADQSQRPQKKCFDLSVEFPIGKGFERTEHACTRIVDEDVEVARFTLRMSKTRLNGIRVVQVEDDGMKVIEGGKRREGAAGAPHLVAPAAQGTDGQKSD